jgi:hypothetical protein
VSECLSVCLSDERLQEIYVYLNNAGELLDLVACPSNFNSQRLSWLLEFAKVHAWEAAPRRRVSTAWSEGFRLRDALNHLYAAVDARLQSKRNSARKLCRNTHVARVQLKLLQEWHAFQTQMNISCDSMNTIQVCHVTSVLAFIGGQASTGRPPVTK